MVAIQLKEIHDGPYNVIKNGENTGLVNAIHNGEAKCWTAKASGAIFFSLLHKRVQFMKWYKQKMNWWKQLQQQQGNKRILYVPSKLVAHKDDTSKELPEWYLVCLPLTADHQILNNASAIPDFVNRWI